MGFLGPVSGMPVADRLGQFEAGPVGGSIVSKLSSVRVSPASVKLANGANQTFTATGYDQFGGTMTANFTLTKASGGGTFSSPTLTSDGTKAVINAANGSISGNAYVNYPQGSGGALLILLLLTQDD